MLILQLALYGDLDGSFCLSLYGRIGMLNKHLKYIYIYMFKGRIPLKWTAIEALVDEKYTIASDV